MWGGRGGRHTKGPATDISWKLLDDVSAHQRTATAIVGLIGDGDLGGIAQLRASAFPVCCRRT